MILATTGHRKRACEDESVVRERLRETFDEASPSVVIVGLCNGFDLWAGDEAHRQGVEVWSVKPWAGHGPEAGDESLYEDVASQSAKVITVVNQEEFPGPYCYHKRNEWMVDHATHVLAYWNGEPKGGTYACRNYAIKTGKPVRNIYAKSV